MVCDGLRGEERGEGVDGSGGEFDGKEREERWDRKREYDERDERYLREKACKEEVGCVRNKSRVSNGIGKPSFEARYWCALTLTFALGGLRMTITLLFFLVQKRPASESRPYNSECI